MPRSRISPLARILFFSRWLQLPLYLGLIVAQTVLHITFLVYALAIAAGDRIMLQGRPQAAKSAAGGGDQGTH